MDSSMAKSSRTLPGQIPGLIWSGQLSARCVGRFARRSRLRVAGGILASDLPRRQYGPYQCTIDNLVPMWPASQFQAAPSPKSTSNAGFAWDRGLE